jgi:hypothetical protein
MPRHEQLCGPARGADPDRSLAACLQHQQPHESLDWKTPSEYISALGEAATPPRAGLPRALHESSILRYPQHTHSPVKAHRGRNKDGGPVSTDAELAYLYGIETMTSYSMLTSDRS